MTWVKELLNVPAREVFSQERTYELGLERAHEKACQHREDECSRGGIADAQTLSQDAWDDPGTEQKRQCS